MYLHNEMPLLSCLVASGVTVASSRNFFDDEVKGSYDRLNGVMDFLLIELKTGRTVQIFVKGYTSPLASSRYNEYLAGRRISSIHNYFNQGG